MELAGKLNDSHVAYNAPGRADRLGSHFPPLWLGRVEGKVVITWLHSLAENAEISVGDEVLAIDGEPIEAVERKRRSRSSFSTEQAFNKGWFLAVRGHEGTEVALTLRRNDRHWTVRLNHNLSRNELPALRWADRDGYRRFPGGVGYINMGGFESGEALEETFESYRDSQGLIFDLRWPSGPDIEYRWWFVDHLAERRVKRASEQTPVIASHDRSVIQFVPYLEFYPQYDVAPSRWWEPAGPEPFTKPVVVLIGEYDQSHFENVCMVLQGIDHVTLVGGKTTGTTGNVTHIPLPGGGRLYFTGMRVFFPDGSRFQNIGVTPDVEVYPTIEGIKAGRDEVLEKGIEVLRQKIAAQGRL